MIPLLLSGGGQKIGEVTLRHSASVQSITVPEGAQFAWVEMWPEGGQAGQGITAHGSGSPGGPGAYLSALHAVTAGETLLADLRSNGDSGAVYVGAALAGSGIALLRGSTPLMIGGGGGQGGGAPQYSDSTPGYGGPAGQDGGNSTGFPSTNGGKAGANGVGGLAGTAAYPAYDGTATSGGSPDGIGGGGGGGYGGGGGGAGGNGGYNVQWGGGGGGGAGSRIDPSALYPNIKSRTFGHIDPPGTTSVHYPNDQSGFGGTTISSGQTMKNHFVYIGFYSGDPVSSGLEAVI